jgi:uncharacterized iron-regulated membrane protein
MFQTLRQSMTWLHTWAGVVLGGLLFVIFFMGTLSVFDREIDRWMMPSTRLAAPTGTVSLDAIRPQIDKLVGGTGDYAVFLPDERTPFLLVSFRSKQGSRSIAIDPATGELLPEAQTLGASRFFYPLHYSLLIRFMNIGPWIVGVAAMAMMALLVTGIIIHSGILTNFFTFRPRERLHRSSLDLHTLVGVAGLPFEIFITLSGLVIFFSIYLPAGINAVYPGSQKAFFDELSDSYRRPKAGVPGAVGSLDAMQAEAMRRWGGAPARLFRVVNAGDRSVYLEWQRSTNERVGTGGEIVYFDGPSSAVLHQSAERPVRSVLEFITGMHLMRFGLWPLRFLYFFAGLGGCVLIATGLVIWVEKRKPRESARGIALVRAMTISVVTGLVLATAGFFAANRLPAEGLGQASFEVGVFFGLWILSAIHAGWRSAKGQAGSAWREQASTIFLLCMAAIVLNWVTTGFYVAKGWQAINWAVAGTDAALLASALIAARIASHLKVRESALTAVLECSKAAE